MSRDYTPIQLNIEEQTLYGGGCKIGNQTYVASKYKTATLTSVTMINIPIYTDGVTCLKMYINALIRPGGLYYSYINYPTWITTGGVTTYSGFTDQYTLGFTSLNWSQSITPASGSNPTYVNIIVNNSSVYTAYISLYGLYNRVTFNTIPELPRRIAYRGSPYDISYEIENRSPFQQIGPARIYKYEVNLTANTVSVLGQPITMERHDTYIPSVNTQSTSLLLDILYLGAATSNLTGVSALGCRVNRFQVITSVDLATPVIRNTTDYVNVTNNTFVADLVLAAGSNLESPQTMASVTPRFVISTGSPSTINVYIVAILCATNDTNFF